VVIACLFSPAGPKYLRHLTICHVTSSLSHYATPVLLHPMAYSFTYHTQLSPNAFFAQNSLVFLKAYFHYGFIPTEAVGDSGMVPFERALVSSYRPSIVTFPLSLRVSDILPLLWCSIPLFPTPPQNFPMFPWAAKSDFVGLIVRAIISFQNFQPMCSWSTNVTDRQTDRQTTCNHNIALCTIVHRAVKIDWLNACYHLPSCWMFISVR